MRRLVLLLANLIINDVIYVLEINKAHNRVMMFPSTTKKLPIPKGSWAKTKPNYQLESVPLVESTSTILS
jgi:hypothetical protein